MVTIISKGGGPSRHESDARKIVEQNRSKIDAVVRTLKGGPLGQAAEAPPSPPSPAEQAFFRRFSASLPASRGETEPYVRISLNNRVVVADANSARQLLFLGELRGPPALRRFVLATRENGFFSPLEDEVRAKLSDLDGALVRDAAAADKLAATISERLEIPVTDR